MNSQQQQLLHLIYTDVLAALAAFDRQQTRIAELEAALDSLCTDIESTEPNVKQSHKNANASFIDTRDWCGMILAAKAKARAVLARKARKNSSRFLLDLSFANTVNDSARMEQTMKCPKCEGTGQVLDPRAVGAELRHEREQAGISLRSFAKKMHRSAPYLSDLELGRRLWTDGLISDFRAVLRAAKPSRKARKS